MNDLPRREPAPLYARPGRFEDTLRRARKRRQRNTVLASAALVVVCAGGVTGAMSLASGPGNPQIAEPPTVATSGLDNSGGAGSGSAASTGPVTRPTPSGSPGAHGSSANGPSTHPSGSASPDRSISQASKSTAGHPLYHGRAVDAAGRPLAQIGVYVEQNGRQVRVATTKSDGSFSIPVTTAPVLLAAGDFTGPRPAGASGQQNYAYTYVDASTVPASSYAATVMSTGGQLSVTVTDPSGQPIAASTEPELYCDASDTPCYTMTADSSGKYTFSGLPTGDYTLRGTYAQHTYHVDAGQTTKVIWVEAPSTPPASPTNSPSPTPSTSEAPSTQSPTTQGPSTQGPSTQGASTQGPDAGTKTAQSAGTTQ